MEGGSVARAPPRGPLSPRFRKVLVLLIAVGAVAAAIVSIVVYRESLPPREIEFLGTTNLLLRVPLMTLYAVGDSQSQRISSWTNFSFDSDTAWRFRWIVEGGASEQVRFVFRGEDLPRHEFEPGPELTLLFYPAGKAADGRTSWTFGLRPGADPETSGAYWNASFTVRRMTGHRGFGEETWTQVDYSLHSKTHCGCSFDEMNVSWPSPENLLAHEGPIVIDSGVHIGFSSPNTGFGPFRYSGESYMIPAGRLGTLRVHLASEFEWRPGSAYTLELTSIGDPVRLRSYLDLRFGSLFVEWSDAT